MTRPPPATGATPSCAAGVRGADRVAAYAAVELARSGTAAARDARATAPGSARCVLVAHLALRRCAPYADPVLLPVVTLLNGLGLAMIHRLDLADGRPGPPARPDGAQRRRAAQLTWTAVGVALFVAVLVLVRDHRVLQRYTYTAMLVGLVLLLLPLRARARRHRSTAHASGSGSAGFSLPARRARQDRLIVFFAGYLVVKRDVLALAGRRVLGVDLPRGRDLGPILRRLAGHPRRARLRARPRHVAAVLRPVRRRCSTSPPSGGPGCSSACCSSSAARSSPGRCSATSSQRVEHLAATRSPTPTSAGGSYQIVQSLYGFASGGLLGTGLGQGHPDLVPLRQERLHRRGLRRGARPDRPDGDARALRHRRRARAAHRGRRAATRSASCSPPVCRSPRPAGVRRRRRRHPADPADRADHAVPLLRRLVAGRQLGAGRAAAADQRRRAPARAGPAPPPAPPSSSDETQVVRL